MWLCKAEGEEHWIKRKFMGKVRERTNGIEKRELKENKTRYESN